MFGLPGFVHTDRGSCFSAKVFKDFLHFRGIATSGTTPYHPTGNIHKANAGTKQFGEQSNSCCIAEDFQKKLGKMFSKMPYILLDHFYALQRISTPHDRFFQFHRRSMLGKSIPSWPLNPGPVFLQNFVKNKGDPLCYEVELIESNSQFAHVRFKDGKECTVSTKDLAPKPCQDSASDNNGLQTSVPDDNTETEIATNLDKQQPEITSNPPLPDELQNTTKETSQTDEMLPQPTTPDPRHELIRSTQIRKAPIRYGNPILLVLLMFSMHIV